MNVSTSSDPYLLDRVARELAQRCQRAVADPLQRAGVYRAALEALGMERPGVIQRGLLRTMYYREADDGRFYPFSAPARRNVTVIESLGRLFCPDRGLVSWDALLEADLAGWQPPQDAHRWAVGLEDAVSPVEGAGDVALPAALIDGLPNLSWLRPNPHALWQQRVVQAVADEAPWQGQLWRSAALTVRQAVLRSVAAHAVVAVVPSQVVTDVSEDGLRMIQGLTMDVRFDPPHGPTLALDLSHLSNACRFLMARPGYGFSRGPERSIRTLDTWSTFVPMPEREEAALARIAQVIGQAYLALRRPEPAGRRPRL